jgi:hypothetical protein
MGTDTTMTAPEDKTTPDTPDEEVLTVATPGAQALPLPDDQVDKPSEQ